MLEPNAPQVQPPRKGKRKPAPNDTPGANSAGSDDTLDKPSADKSLDTLIDWFHDSEMTTIEARALSERSRDYYDGKQFTAGELATLKKRGQPNIVINRIQNKVNYLLGYEAQQRADPQGYPRTPQDEDAAAACTDALRYVKDKADLEQVFSRVWENILIEGAGGCEVVPQLREGDAEFQVKKIHWDRIYYDPHSREHDFSDARYLGTVVWMDEEEALTHWPKGKEIFVKTISDDATRTYTDRPAYKQWAQGGRRRRIRIVQCYYWLTDPENGELVWNWCIFTSGGKLESGVVPYKDEDGKSLCPLILESAFIDRLNNRYGIVRAMLGPQDEINKRRSKMLHEASVRQFQYEDGAVDDVELTKSELAKPDGAIKVNPGFNFQMIDRSKEISAHAALQTEAKQEIDLIGPNAAMAGKEAGSPSGRAILANQQGGQVEIALLMDRLRHFKQRVYKLLWAMVRQYWTAQKWIRVTDDEKNVRFVGLNRQVSLAEDLLEQAKKAGANDDQAKQALKAKIDMLTQAMMARVPPMMQQQALSQIQQHIAEQFQQVIRTEHVPADMTMDIILEEIPDVANIQQEQFQILAELAKTKAVPIPPEVIIQASGLRNKDKLLETLEANKKQPDPAQEAMKQAQIQKAIAEVEELKVTIDKIKADTVQSLAKADALDLRFQQVVLPQAIQQAGLVPQLQQMPPDGAATPQGPGVPPLPPQMQGGPQGAPPVPPSPPMPPLPAQMPNGPPPPPPG